MFRTVEEALEHLEEVHGDEVRDAFAGRTEEPWEYHPECVDGDPSWYEWCGDCETFHTSWYLYGYEVSEGNVEVIVWCCDQDGNWDVTEGAYIGSPEARAIEETYGYKAWERNYAEYLRHVAETGEDPCGEFIPPTPKEVVEPWMVRVVERGEKVWVLHCTNLVTKEHYERPDKLPSYVQEFLLLEKLGDVSACAIDPENVKSIADLSSEKWVPEAGRSNEWVATVVITHKVPSLTDEEWSKILREKANLARAKMALRDS
jgi:hypothetical protein